MRIPRKVLQKALRIAARFSVDWPEDDWFSINDDWDLNLSGYYHHGVLICEAVLYPVIGGNTKTDVWEKILEFIPKEGQRVPEES